MGTDYSQSEHQDVTPAATGERLGQCQVNDVCGGAPPPNLYEGPEQLSHPRERGKAGAYALQGIANAGGGSFSEGNVDSIIQLYRDLASFF